MERADLEQWRPKDVARLLALVEGQRRYFQEIVAVLPVGILVLSADLEVMLANAAVRKILNLPEQGPLRLRIDAVLPHSALDRVRQVTKTRAAETNIAVDAGAGRRLQIGIAVIPAWEEEGGREVLLTIQELGGVAADSAAVPLGSVPVRKSMSAPLTADLPDHLAAVLWAVEPRSMRPIFVSPQAQQLLGFAGTFWIDNPSFWSDRVHPGDRERVTQFYQRALKSAGDSACEFRSVRPDGQVAWLRETVRMVTDAGGQPIYLAGITVDVSERRMLEEQLVQRERIEAMQKLASRMAHDLNNMLMILEGNAEEVLNGLPAGSDLRGEMEAIVAAAQRITGLTGHLLAFSRRPPPVTEPVELETVLSAAVQKFGLQRKGPLSRSQVNANAAQLEQVLAAAVAAAGLPSGAVTIEATNVEIREDLQREEPLVPGDYVAITIAGSGGKVEFAQGAFERFLPEKGAVDDTAVKLAQAYAMVRQWGGDIAVAGSMETSTAFRIFLQRVGEAGNPVGPVSEPSEPKAERQVATVLVVEDEAGIRALVQKFLRRHGYDILEASNGEQALEVVRGHRGSIDLLITDMIMPQMGGRELVDRLRAQGRDLKILYISGYTDDTTVYAAELPPGSAFLQKPFTLGALLEKVRGLLVS
ncbi:MAG TPA: response regulator [Bryobacteraceae bacterium]|nr:response regulator [Bryobacteraceae bacterium]